MAESPLRHLLCYQQAGIPVVMLTDSRLHGDELMEEVRQELLAVYEQFGVPKMIIDFRHVTHMSSAGFRPLLSLHRRLQEKKGRLVFCNLAHDVAEVFLVTRLISSSRSSTAPFEMARDVADALARLRHHIATLEQGVLVLTVTEKEMSGEDLAEDLGKEWQNSVDQAGLKKVVLDLQHVQFLSTSCMRPMLNLRTYLRNQGGRIALCNLDPKVAEILTITRLVSTSGSGPVPFEAAPDVPAAIALLNSEVPK